MSSEYLYHSVDAAHIRNIGEESVSNKIQAVIELVKNAMMQMQQHVLSHSLEKWGGIRKSR